jgi:hypothetical protein
MVLISISQSHRLGKEPVPCPLGNVLLMMQVVAYIVFDKKV